MRRFLLSVAALSGLAGAAQASDLPSIKSPPPPVFTAAPPAFSWTGLYVGAEGGGDFGRTHGALDVAAAGVTPYNTRRASGLAGGMVGYNQQLGAFVLGVEGNVDGVFGGRRTSPVINGAATYGVSSAESYNADVRGRVGYAVDRALFFASGGVAFGNPATTYSGGALAAPDSFNSQRVGWTAGGGLDYAFTNNIIGRAEYRFTDFGPASYANATTGVTDRTRAQSNAALLGVMYKFGAP